ncbi:MAG: hypothetical protein IH848_02180 [Acidobacteria bacterium]|nr:hypothetical protein [Acidobacteriota bacterium]
MKAVAVALAAVASLASYAALIGWLKTVYFLRPFGLSPAALDSGWVESAFQSWYVVQNLVYFTWIVWLVVQTRRFTFALVAVVYSLIPLATHYAFLHYDRVWVRWWVDHQHTWLKLVPLLLLALVVVGRIRGGGLQWRWRHGAAGLVLLGMVTGSWGLSAAKHFGSYDAERILHRPDELLPRVELTWKESPPARWEAGGDLFLLHEDRLTLVVVEFTAGTGWERRMPRVHTIGRGELRHVVVSPRTAVQPGGQYL